MIPSFTHRFLLFPKEDSMHRSRRHFHLRAAAEVDREGHQTAMMSAKVCIYQLKM